MRRTAALLVRVPGRVPAVILFLLLAAGGLPSSVPAGDEQLKVRPGQVPAVELLPALPPEPLVPPGPSPDLEILFSSQVQGYYQPCG
jgi:hypothetical protein